MSKDLKKRNQSELRSTQGNSSRIIWRHGEGNLKDLSSLVPEGLHTGKKNTENWNYNELRA